MNNKPIETVEDLIERLKAYPLDTEVSHLTRNGNNKIIGDLYITETHPIGSRETEDILLLAFSDSLNNS